MTDSETLVVNGLYEHVNFIHRPRPLVIDLFDLSPPEPPRLLDMARRVLAHRDFPAVVLNPHIRSIPELVREIGEKPILFPCGVSQLKAMTKAFYLDERPPRQDWINASLGTGNNQVSGVTDSAGDFNLVGVSAGDGTIVFSRGSCNGAVLLSDVITNPTVVLSDTALDCNQATPAHVDDTFEELPGNKPTSQSGDLSAIAQAVMSDRSRIVKTDSSTD